MIDLFSYIYLVSHNLAEFIIPGVFCSFHMLMLVQNTLHFCLQKEREKTIRPRWSTLSAGLSYFSEISHQSNHPL